MESSQKSEGGVGKVVNPDPNQPRIQVFGKVRVQTNKLPHDHDHKDQDDTTVDGGSADAGGSCPHADGEHSHSHGHGHAHHQQQKKPQPELKFVANIPEIDLTNERLTEIPKGISNLQKLTKLTLRSNSIADISNLNQLRSLTDLDLYENSICEIKGLSECPSLTSLDLSFNPIRAIRNLNPLGKTLQKLYLIQCKITDIEGLDDLKNLELLEFGSNRIRKIQNLDTLENLKELFLGRNKITELSGLDNLPCLTKLSMQSNRIVTIGHGLSRLTNLTELYLSHNGIQKIDGLSYVPQLKVLDLGGNQIKKLENIEDLVNLEELWMNNNFLSDFRDLDCIKAKGLKTIYLEQNPLSKDPDYEKKVLQALPSVRQLDADVYEDPVDEAKAPASEEQGNM